MMHKQISEYYIQYSPFGIFKIISISILKNSRWNIAKIILYIEYRNVRTMKLFPGVIIDW